ncbi:GAP family protein [Bacillus sp. E(2018)]|uniref:GAP family protein n=1 Tax=Bacillus sp. E(2018) TaxID=2502239 RepID=UPI0010F43F76|nr:GAP family protein [Bacillus sp. E(2018)]
MTVELLLIIGGLAVLDMLSPATIGVTVYLLLNEKEKRSSQILFYLLIVAGFYFVVGVSLMLGISTLLESVSNIFQNQSISWIIFIIGAILFIASFYVPAKKSPNLPYPKSKGLISIIVLGLSTSLIEVGTAFPYFAAIGILSTSDLTIMEWISILAGYNLIMILPPLLLYFIYLLFGRWMDKPLKNLRESLVKNSGSALSWIMCIVGIILIFNSLDYL